MEDTLKQKILKITSKYQDPSTKKSYDEHNLSISIVINNNNVNIAIEIDPSKSSEYEDLIGKIKDEIKLINEINSINIVLTSETKTENKQNQKIIEIKAKKVIAIASGKGGVGKSTFAVNFAVSLKSLGKKVGILDADIYGPSIPRMMGISKKPQINKNKKLVPIENYGIKCMSIGFLIDVDTPTIWRGPMVMKAIVQMIGGVEWGELDYLVIDLPPGTGDAQLTLAQNSRLTGAIIISTPQDVALIDAVKGIKMFEKVNIPVLGIIENMSYFICENCETRHEIFSNGGAKRESEKFGISFLGEIPLDKNIRIQSDNGNPICISEPNNAISQTYLSIAKKILDAE